ncbi:MAG: GNAT family N-acetyltransferase [Desulfarculus sp.]|nr:GNAT family N-acetyltransferase [Desulfarculus sp.]
MSLTQGQPEIEPGQEVEIGLFRPQDADGVAASFRAVYGEGYPVKVYYQPPELIAAVGRGEIICVVARTPRGEVVGVVNFFNSAPFNGIYEIGAGLVLPSFRQRGLNTLMINYMLDQAVPQRGVPMGFGEAVCNHTHLQKTQEARGYAHTALEVDLMPAAAYGREQSASGRVAVMASFRAYEPNSHAVYLPPRYAAALREIYTSSGQERAFLEADPGATLLGSTELKAQVFDFAQAARVAVHETGADLEGRLDELLAGLEDQGVVVVQAWLKLASPLVGRAVEVFRARGFFLGGVLLRWFDQDGLLLQKVHGRPNWEEIQVYSPQCRCILDLVRQDWQEVQGELPQGATA